MDTMQKYKDNKYRRVIYLKYNQKVSWEISLQLVFHNYKKEGINYFLPYLENMQAIVSKVQTSFIAIKKNKYHLFDQRTGLLSYEVLPKSSCASEWFWENWTRVGS